LQATRIRPTWAFVVVVVASLAAASGADNAETVPEKGIVVASAKDETFVIATRWGNQKFTAQTYCFNVEKEDRVVFSRSTGTCADNEFTDSRTGSKCKVWCDR
jgi:hypothetical protein